MEAQFTRAQPDLHDGLLGSAREHHADPADRRHAWPGGQPEGRDHPAADQGELPRGHVRARVLHLDARRPEGPGRHRAPDGRLRVPDAPSGRRRAGGHHPRGGLRDRPRSRCTSRTDAGRHPGREPAPRHQALRPRAGRGRQGRRQEDRPRRARSSTTPGAQRADGGRRRDGPRPVGPHLRRRGRRVPALLRPEPRDRAARGHRRGGRHHRRAVDRRAGHAAHHADVPHRWRRRRGHHPRSAARRGAVRGPRPKGEAQITELSGTVEIEDDEEKKVRRITVTSEDGRPGAVRGRRCGPGWRSRRRRRRGRSAAHRGLGQPAREAARRGRAGPADCTWSRRSSRCTARRA